MQQSAQVGALTPRGHTHTMPPSSAQWRLSKQLCRHMFSQHHGKHVLLRQLSPGVPSRTSQPALCSATEPHNSHSSFPGLPQPACRAAAHQRARSTKLRASAAAGTALRGMFAASQRTLTSRSFQGLEPAAFSAQHGLRKSVRLKAISDKGHCGEEGLVKGAGVVRSHASPAYLALSSCMRHDHRLIPAVVQCAMRALPPTHYGSGPLLKH